MYCEWPCLEKGCRCKYCGYKLARTYEDTPIKECYGPIPIGTKLANFFKSFGIKNQCIPCQKREKLLNRFGAWLYSITIGWWNGSRKPSKAKRRKQLLAGLNSPLSPLQEKAMLEKEQRRQTLLAQQFLTEINS